MIEQTRYRTREGMKTTVRKGKAAGGLAYGYRIKFEYDAKGDRVPGLREINEEEAEIVRWIYQQYVLGRSPKELAVDLNNRVPPVPGVNRHRNGTPYRLPKGTPASGCIGSARVGPELSI